MRRPAGLPLVSRHAPRQKHLRIASWCWRGTSLGKFGTSHDAILKRRGPDNYKALVVSQVAPVLLHSFCCLPCAKCATTGFIRWLLWLRWTRSLMALPTRPRPRPHSACGCSSGCLRKRWERGGEAVRRRCGARRRTGKRGGQRGGEGSEDRRIGGSEELERPTRGRGEADAGGKEV